MTGKDFSKELTLLLIGFNRQNVYAKLTAAISFIGDFTNSQLRHIETTFGEPSPIRSR